VLKSTAGALRIKLNNLQAARTEIILADRTEVQQFVSEKHIRHDKGIG